jgi:HAD superfamily hydrolase (TIGR01509 family)
MFIQTVNAYRGAIYTPLWLLVKNGNGYKTGIFQHRKNLRDNQEACYMKSKLEALLLDVDGTLADTEEVHRQAFNSAFEKAGLDWVWGQDLYHELLAVTGGKERIRYYLDRDRPDVSLPDDADAFIAQLHQSKTQFFVDSLAAGSVPLRPGVERLIRDAKAHGLRLAIVTTTSPENVIALFEHSFAGGVADLFDVVAAGSVVPNKKPAADIYEYALSELGLDPGQCIAIEDSANGLESALAAGVATLITVNRYTEDHDFSGALAVLDHLGEPAMPCRMMQGALQPGAYVDTGYLQTLHAHSQAST